MEYIKIIYRNCHRDNYDRIEIRYKETGGMIGNIRIDKDLELGMIFEPDINTLITPNAFLEIAVLFYEFKCQSRRHECPECGTLMYFSYPDKPFLEQPCQNNKCKGGLKSCEEIITEEINGGATHETRQIPDSCERMAKTLNSRGILGIHHKEILQKRSTTRIQEPEGSRISDRGTVDSRRRSEARDQERIPREPGIRGSLEQLPEIQQEPNNRTAELETPTTETLESRLAKPRNRGRHGRLGSSIDNDGTRPGTQRATPRTTTSKRNEIPATLVQRNAPGRTRKGKTRRELANNTITRIHPRHNERAGRPQRRNTDTTGTQKLRTSHTGKHNDLLEGRLGRTLRRRIAEPIPKDRIDSSKNQIQPPHTTKNLRALNVESRSGERDYRSRDGTRRLETDNIVPGNLLLRHRIRNDAPGSMATKTEDVNERPRDFESQHTLKKGTTPKWVSNLTFLTPLTN
jgi:hypothetical protein